MYQTKLFSSIGINQLIIYNQKLIYLNRKFCAKKCIIAQSNILCTQIKCSETKCFTFKDSTEIKLQSKTSNLIFPNKVCSTVVLFMIVIKPRNKISLLLKLYYNPHISTRQPILQKTTAWGLFQEDRQKKFIIQ